MKIQENFIAELNNLFLINFQNLSQIEKNNYYNKLSFIIKPEKYGEHLIKCWNFLRDQAMFYPWFQNNKENLILNHGLLEIRYLHQRLVALLKAGNNWNSMSKAIISCDEMKLIDKCKSNITFASHKNDPSFRVMKNYYESRSDRTSIEFTGNQSEWLTELQV